jgi:hypothetical protein
MHTVTPGVSTRAFRATPAVRSRARDPSIEQNSTANSSLHFEKFYLVQSSSSI